MILVVAAEGVNIAARGVLLAVALRRGDGVCSADTAVAATNSIES